jgi:PAS domain S-box-containing protein
MKEKKTGPDRFAALRQRAEEMLRRQPEELREMRPEDIQHLIHELRVHQIELEMQNEELRRIQRELELSRDRYSDLYDFAPVGYFTLSEAGLILQANLTAATMLGVDRGRLIRQPLSSFIFSEDQDIYYFHRKQLFETREPQVCEMRMVRKDGSQFWARIEAAMALDSEGQAVCAVCRAAMSDITDRKRAEELLELERKRLSMLLETFPGYIYLQSPGYSVRYANRYFIEHFGEPKERLCYEVLWGRKEPCEVCPTFEVFDTKAPQVWEWSQTPDGRIYVIYDHPFIDSDGSELVLEIGVDITDRKRAEERLEHLNLVLRAIRRVNQLIARERDRDGLLRGACDSLIETRGYYNAWITLLDEAGGLVTTAEAGLGEEFTPIVERLKCGELTACGRRALTQSEVVVTQDPPSACADCPLAMNYGGRGALTVRLEHGGKVYGLLSASIPAHLTTDREEQVLFEEVARDIAFALHGIELAEERKRAEEALQQSYAKLQKVLQGTIHTLASAIEIRDPYTSGHQRRVTQLACAIANEMGLLQEQIEGLRMAGLIHDIGKISIPAEVLSKSGELSYIEWGMIKAHPQIGYNMLKDMDFPWPPADIVLQHHERLDGSGYPQGLSDGEIMLEARILAVADVVEAMSSHRPYRPAHTIDEALEEIAQNRGRLYDPEAVDACLKLFTEGRFTLE